MLIRTETRNGILFGDDIMDVTSWLANSPKFWSQNSSHKPSSHEWDYGADWDKTLRLAREGWPEGTAQVAMAASQVQPVARAASFSYDVAGEFPDVGRYCAGDPAHMRARRRDKAHTPTIHLIVNTNCSGGVRAESFVRYGGAIAALVDQIENSGRRCELDVLAVNSHHGKGRSRCGWKVKRAEDPLDLGAVAFAVAHPASFRRLMFAMWERTPKDWETYGYGTVSSITPEDAAFIGAEDNAVLLDGVGMAGGHITVDEVNKRLIANVEKAVGFKLIEEDTL